MSNFNQSKEELIFELQKLREENSVLKTKYEKDVLKLKQKIESLELKEEQQKVFLQSTLNGFFRTDMKGRLLEVNEAYCRMSGYSKQELLKLRITDLDSTENEEATAYHLQKIKESKSERFETKHRRKDGSIFDIEVSTQYLDINGGQIVSFTNDITERKTSELQLRNRIGMEELSNEISFQFVRSSYLETDKLINASLKKIGLFTRVDRIGVYLYEENGSLLNNRYEWCNEGIKSLINNLQHIPVETFPWWADKMEKFEIINYANIADFPLEALAERNFLKPLDTTSILAIPMINEGQLKGTVTFSSIKYKKTWHDADIKVLRTLADLISGEISRTKRMHELVEAKQNAIEKEYKFRKLSNLTFEGILIMNNGTVVDMNKSFSRIVGYNSKDLLGKNLIEIGIAQKYRSVFRKNIIKEHAFPYEIEMISKDGSLIPVEIESKFIVENDSNKTTRVVAVRDIRWRKKVQAEISKLIMAVEQSANSIVITDIHGNIEYSNPKFTEVSGYPPEEVLGEHIKMLASGMLPKEFYLDMWETITAGKIWKGIFHNKKKNGDFYWEQSTIAPIKNDDLEIVNFMTINEDITALKESERQLKIQNLELIKAKEKAEESDRLKSAFLTNMSHEIRTPMNGILGFASLLLEPDLDSEERDKYINLVHQSGQRMLNTVNEIVEISKIEAGIIPVNNEDTNINECIEELVYFFSPEAEQKGLQLIVDKLLPITEKNITTDRTKLDSIFTNLIKNAIKFTKSGTINIGCRKKGSSIECYIKDTGIGIPTDKQDAVFERFVQVDTANTRKFEGLGLGLSIVKSYVEILGGKIWIESAEGEGSQFYFTIPCVPVEKEE